MSQLLNADVAQIAMILISAGEMFSGGDAGRAAEIAQDWDDHDFTPDGVEMWTNVGCWDAAAADELLAAGFRPRRDTLAYKDGRDADAMYSLCNGDCSIGDLCW